MEIEPLAVEGAWLIRPTQWPDDRGALLEWYRPDLLARRIGHEPVIAQANLVVSRAGVIRGIHFADVPPGQAKYVTCVSGSVLDVVVDVRVGSPTFGQHVAVPLDDVGRHAVYLAEGLGHAVCALSPDATVTYLCSTGYRPGADHTVHPLDPDIGVRWPAGELVLSDRDAAAPSLAEAAEKGLLPSWEACREWSRSMASTSS
ncbi:dTDP-4-dehydrorhamnose 3,5-epimerase family protein [Micromonospora sp. NPDC049903]|uniref:dTDP-4-dehydrorhamnose 3,5-epimerase family protein n=1 Tax=Micromonospora sp. NPDC049903 TaxID=3364276 RepID=UPI0037BDC843